MYICFALLILILRKQFHTIQTLYTKNNYQKKNKTNTPNSEWTSMPYMVLTQMTEIDHSTEKSQQMHPVAGAVRGTHNANNSGVHRVVRGSHYG